MNDCNNHIISNIVTVVAKTNANPFEFWKEVLDVLPVLTVNSPSGVLPDDSKENHQEISVTKTANTIIKTNVGILISKKGATTNSLYILSTFHGLSNGYEFYMHYGIGSNIIKVPLNLKFSSPEMDITVLTIDEKFSGFKNKIGININIIDNEIPQSTNDIFSIICRFPKIIDNENAIIDIKEIKCTIKEIKFSRYMSQISPMIPIIQIQLIDKTLIENGLEGLSGACMVKNNKIYGIVSSICEETGLITIIPSICINRFFKEIITTKKYDGLCDIVGNLQICNFEHENIFYNGLFLEETFGINYIKNTEFKKNLKQKDIITYMGIKKKQPDQNGEYFCHHCKMNLPLNTYIALHYNSGDKIPLTVYREIDTHENISTKSNKSVRLVKLAKSPISNKKVIEYNLIDVTISAKPVNMMSYIPIINCGRSLMFENLVFVELSEDMFIHYNNKGIEIGGYVMEIYLNNCYRNNNTHKIIILADVLFDKLNDRQKDIYTKSNFPLKNISGSKYCIPVLTKINKKLIRNIDQLETYISNLRISLQNINLYFTLENKNDVKIRYNQHDGKITMFK